MKLMTNIYLSAQDSIPIHNHCILVSLTSVVCIFFFKAHLGAICLFKCKYRMGVKSTAFPFLLCISELEWVVMGGKRRESDKEVTHLS